MNVMAVEPSPIMAHKTKNMKAPCDNCGRHGTFDLEVIDNDWAREHTKIVKGERSFVRQFKGWKK